jgi:hypothetical protein
MKINIGLTLLCVFLAACAKAEKSITPLNLVPTVPISASAITVTLAPTATITPTATFTPIAKPDTRLTPDDWKKWPVVPTVQPEMRVVFERGVTLGNDPKAFSKIGDGEISTVWFLTQYDRDPKYYRLGPYTDLLPVIKHFSGSFSWVGPAAGRGYDTTIILGKVLSGTPDCNPGETHLDCELRIHHPEFAIISMGTNQIHQPEIFQPEMKKIIERLLNAGVVPILSTKADNLEGDYRINRIIANLAYEYNLPLWNFWLAVQPLPNHGLQADEEHLTYAYNDFSNPENFQFAWPWRNLTALQVLNTVYNYVSSQP